MTKRGQKAKGVDKVTERDPKGAGRRVRRRVFFSLAVLGVLAAAVFLLAFPPSWGVQATPPDEPVDQTDPPEPTPEGASSSELVLAPAAGYGPDGEGATSLLSSPLLAAVLAAAAGGLVQEMLQSGGAIVLPRRRDDGAIYLGSIVGAVAGGAGGVLALQSVPALGVPFAFAVGFGAKASLETLPRVTSARKAAREAVDPAPA